MKNEFKGTKGEWKMARSQSGKHNINIIGTVLGGKYKVARVPYEVGDITNDEYMQKLNERWEQEAIYDAHLIAAAPDLLSALQLLLQGWNDPDINHDVTESFNIAQSAVAKALNITSNN